MSDILIDIISSIHIWFVFNLGSNSEYGDLKNITHLIQLITQSSLSNNVSIINEKIYWNSCWMNIDLTNVELYNMSKCNGYSSNIKWPNNMTHYINNNMYNIFSTINCFVSEIIYNDEIILNIELTDNNNNEINISLPNTNTTSTNNNTFNNDIDIDDCDGIEFTICNTDKIYTEVNNLNHSLLTTYDIPICEYSLLDNNNNNNWNTSGCYVSSYTSSCVRCICTHLTLFKANSDEFTPEINILTKSSFNDINIKYIFEHPLPLIFVLLLTIIFLFLWLISIKYFQHKNDYKPLIAIPDIINKDIQIEMINNSGYANAIIEIHKKNVNICS
eukprot:545812_1